MVIPFSPRPPAPSAAHLMIVRITRLVAWLSVLGALLLLAAFYDRLPEVIPLTRWSTAPRSPLLAWRVPAINALSLVLVEVLVRSLSRSAFAREAPGVSAALLGTLAAKALFEVLELLTFPRSRAAAALTILSLVVGLGVMLWLGRHLLARSAWNELELSRGERWLVSLSGLLILMLQLAPLAR